MSAPRIASLQVGQPVDYPADAPSPGKAWTSAIDKRPVEPPVRCEPLGLAGDAVADPRYHGGVDKAVLCYPAAHYDYWREVHPSADWRPGAFGENVSVADLTEEDVCVGDVWRASGVLFEVSQPRQPCWKLARLHGLPTIVKESAKTGRTGWYVRVREAGELGYEPLELVERPRPQWTIARCNGLLFGDARELSDVKALFAVPELAADWKSSLGLPG